MPICKRIPLIWTQELSFSTASAFAFHQNKILLLVSNISAAWRNIAFAVVPFSIKTAYFRFYKPSRISQPHDRLPLKYYHKLMHRQEPEIGSSSQRTHTSGKWQRGDFLSHLSRRELPTTLLKCQTQIVIFNTRT